MTQTRTPAAPRPPRLQPAGSIKLTGRGAVLALFAACLFGLLIAGWTGWTALADATFVMSCGVVAYYTRAKGLRNVVVCPPLAFFAGTVCAEVLTAPGGFAAAEGILVTLGSSAPWLFTGTALTIVIAIGRGYRPAWTASTNLIEAIRRRRLVPRRGAGGAELPRQGKGHVLLDRFNFGHRGEPEAGQLG